MFVISLFIYNNYFWNVFAPYFTQKRLNSKYSQTPLSNKKCINLYLYMHSNRESGVCKMASYTLSLQCKCSVKVIFDRVCSVAITLKFQDVCLSNRRFSIRKTWSDIDSDENVSALATLGLRYIVYLPWKTRLPTLMMSRTWKQTNVLTWSVCVCVYVFVCFNLYDIKSVRNLITDSGEAFNKKKKKKKSTRLRPYSIFWCGGQTNNFFLALRGYYTRNLKLACFVCHLKIINTFFEKNKIIIQGTTKWHWNSNRPSDSYVMSQNGQNIVLINNSRTAWPT